MRRLRTSASLRRVDGTPWTMTSKTFCSSNTLPTWMPCNKVASVRRTSPGVTPRRCAFCRFTSISIVGWVGATIVRGRLTPSTPAIISCTRAACSARTFGSWPKMRTATGSCRPVSRFSPLPVTGLLPATRAPTSRISWVEIPTTDEATSLTERAASSIAVTVVSWSALGGDGHPDVARADVDRTVAGHGASYVGTDALDPGNGLDRTHDLGRLLRHAGVRRSGLGLELHDDVAVGEAGNQTHLQERQDDEGHQGAGGRGQHSRSESWDEPGHRRVVAGADPRGPGPLPGGARPAQEQQRRQGRSRGHGHHHRGGQSQDVRRHEWSEECAWPSFQHGHRHDREGGDHRGRQ